MRVRSRAERFHRGDRVLDDAVERAAPAGMGSGNDTCPGIGKEDRSAVGGQDAEDQTRHAVTTALGLRPVPVERPVGDVDAGGVDLVGRYETRGRGAEQAADAAAVLEHALAIIAGAETDVESR